MIIRPKIGLEEIYFGMQKPEILAAWGAPFREFEEENGNRTLCYPAKGVGLQLEKQEGKLSWIMIGSPGACILDHLAIGAPADELVKYLQDKLGESPEIDDYGTWSSQTFRNSWVEVQETLGWVTAINFGVNFSENDKPLWPEVDSTNALIPIPCSAENSHGVFPDEPGIAHIPEEPPELTSLCPEAYKYVAPPDAIPLIELLEPGGTSHRWTGKYFYLGYTAKIGFAMSVYLEHFFGGGHYCYLPLEEIERLKVKMSNLCLPSGRNRHRCDLISGFLHVHFPHPEILNPERDWFPPHPGRSIFGLIKMVEGIISRSPTRQPCAPFTTIPAVDDNEL